MRRLIWTLFAVSSAALQAATVNFVQTSVDDANGSTIAAVSTNQWLETGISYSTVTAPAGSSSYRFTHWTTSSNPSELYRDPWGRSTNPISVALYEDTTASAHYLPATTDSDTDGVPDWFEIEYFASLTNDAMSDTDGDGIALLAEYTGGTHPLYANSSLEGGAAYADAGLITCNLAGYATYALRSIPEGTVNQSAAVLPGAVVTTPNLSGNAAFGYWTLDGRRQQDAWGVSYPQISFTMDSTNHEAIAYLFTGDSDADNIPDAFEMYYYGTTDNDASSDTDGDGIALLLEYSGGTSPIYAETHQDGGVTWIDSESVTVNLAGFSRYTLSSIPSGTVNQSAVVSGGTVITTPNMTQAAFGYWDVDGVRQQDAWGVALRQTSFTVDAADRTAVAYLFAEDSDGDSINDGYEMYHYGTLAQDASSDTDGDGVPLLAEYTGGTSPIYGESHQDGGVAWVDSGLIAANLQPYDRLSKALVGGVLTDFFSLDPNIVTGLDFGSWSSPALADWDGDGDLDLFVASAEGLRVFRNIGTAHNPNFEELVVGFEGLRAYLASINHPVIAGGDWNGDGYGDLVVGGNIGALRLIASNGSFASSGSETDLALDSTKARPALGDINHDGSIDLLVLLDDGTVRLYLNNGLAMPFGSAGTANALGIAAIDGISISVGDINTDGVADVLLSDSDGSIWEFNNNGSGAFSLMSKVWGGSFSGLATGLTLAAADLDGDGDTDLISGLSNGGLVALRDPSAGRPTGLTATPGANSVQLDWNANWQSRIRGYYVYRSDAATGPWTSLQPDYVPLPSYLDTAASPSVENFYCVSSVSYFFVPGNSQPRKVESLPSDVARASAGKVVLSIRPATGNPGQKIKIKLSIENALGVSGIGMQLRVAYDSTMLQPLAQAQPGAATVVTTGLSKSITFSDNGTTAAGELVIAATSGSLEPGSGKLFTLQFIVGADVPHASTLGVNITGATILDVNGRPLAVEVLQLDQSESGDTYIEGDLNGDGTVTTADKDVLKALIAPMAHPPTGEELAAGDLNGDGALDEKDLMLLIRLLAGFSN